MKLRRSLLLFASACVALVSCAKQGNENNTNLQNTATDKTEQTMKPIQLTKAEFLTRVADYESSPAEWKYLGDKPAIVDFYATWCGPCKRLAPILEELAEEYGDKLVIYKVDVDQEQELAAVFGIQSIPTLLFVPVDGNPQIAQGLLPKSELKKAIETVLGVK